MHDVEQIVGKVQDESKALAQQTKQALQSIRDIGDSFSVKAREIDQHIKASLKSSQDYGQELRNQVDALAQSSSNSAENISEAISRLSNELNNVERLTESVTAKIDNSRGYLHTESENMLSVSRKATEAADYAASAFSRQSNALFKAAEDATEQAKNVQNMHWRLQRESFMSSAKFIVESLHSLAMDFSRMLEGEVDEKTWKAFKKGDVGAFTRRIVDIGDQIPLDKIRSKYGQDSEFRNYVMRYVRQFEELLEQAYQNDYGEMLAATFLSSDVGKLYVTLCKASGRDPKTVKNDTGKAA
jgi:archaellum component FlaC